MATVEIIKEAGTYDKTQITWTPIELIPDIGIAQLEIYYTKTGTNDWLKLVKSSWKDTYSALQQLVNLSLATILINGSEVPADIDPSIHKIRIKRETSYVPYVRFSDGAKLSGRDLNIINTQSKHIIEEEAFRLDVADDNIYKYITALIENYYTKTQIDNFFDSQTLIAAWEIGTDYFVGDVVLHDDPNTESPDIKIWYALQDHKASTSNQPTTVGVGQVFWSLSQNDTILDSLNYIRKLPGIKQENDWNTMYIRSPLAFGLRIVPHGSQVTDVMRIHSPGSGNIAVQVDAQSHLIITEHSRVWAKGRAYFTGNTIVNFLPTTTFIDNPVVSIRGRSGQNTLEIVEGKATSNKSNLLLTATDKVLRLTYNSFVVKNDLTQFIGNFIWFAGNTTENCTGPLDGIVDGEGNLIPTFRGVRFGRNISIGTLPSCNVSFIEKCSIDASTGNLTTAGSITAEEITISGVPSGEYLTTNASGKIIAGVGNPITSRNAVTVANSNTFLSNRDVVYLNNTTGLWTKARANDKKTLAMGVIDSVGGTGGNQTFSVIFSGLVGGYTDLEIGNWYWLSKDIAGEVTSTKPTNVNDLVDAVGIAMSPTSLYVIEGRAHRIPSAGEGGVASGGGSGDVSTDNIWDAKGDIAVATANNQASVLPVGSNGQVLTVDSTTTLGVKWATLSSNFDFGTITEPVEFSLDLGGI